MAILNETATMLLTCPDSAGIVAEVSGFIYRNKGNIIHSDQHTDKQTDTYFMRIEWEIEEKDDIKKNFQPIAERFSMEWSLHFSGDIPRLAIFVSKYDHCLYDILLRNRSGEIRAEIPIVISNHPDLKEIAEYFGIEFRAFPIDESNKKETEKKEIELLRSTNVDLIVLARYMRILSSDFVSKFKNKIINIHHSFLPAFIGAKPYHQAHSRGVKIIGATSHYITADLDRGPIIEQDIVRVSHRDSVLNMVEKGRNLEKLVLSRAIKLHIENKTLVFGNKTVIFD